MKQVFTLCIVYVATFVHCQAQAILGDHDSVTIFQSDNDPVRASKRDPRTSPHLLIDSSVQGPDRNDIKRLALVSRLVASTLTRNVHKN